MSKSYLKQLLTYINKVYDMGEKINTLKDKRLKSPVKISTITFVVLFGFMLQIRSLNRLEHWLKKGKLKTEWHLDYCFLHSSTGIQTVLMFILIAFNLMQLYFFRCIWGFRKKRMLQINIIEDIRDERFIIEDGWHNPLFVKT